MYKIKRQNHENGEKFRECTNRGLTSFSSADPQCRDGFTSWRWGRWATSDTWVLFRVQSLGFLRVGFLEGGISERSNAVEAGKWGATRSLCQVQMLRGIGVLRRQVRDEEDEHHSDWWCWGFAQFDFDNFANFGFLDVGDRFWGWNGREELKKRQREREKERTRVGKRPFCTSKFLIDMVGPNELT